MILLTIYDEKQSGYFYLLLCLLIWPGFVELFFLSYSLSYEDEYNAISFL